MRCRAVVQRELVLQEEPADKAKPVYQNANFPTSPEGRTYHLDTKVSRAEGASSMWVALRAIACGPHGSLLEMTLSLIPFGTL